MTKHAFLSSNSVWRYEERMIERQRKLNNFKQRII